MVYTMQYFRKYIVLIYWDWLTDYLKYNVFLYDVKVYIYMPIFLKFTQYTRVYALGSCTVYHYLLKYKNKIWIFIFY